MRWCESYRWQALLVNTHLVTEDEIHVGKIRWLRIPLQEEP